MTARPLTAAELIAALSQYPPSALVAMHLNGELPFVYMVTDTFSNSNADLSRLFCDGAEPKCNEVVFLKTETIYK